MYLRENLKSRPDFAGAVGDEDTRERICAFYQREERERLYLPDYSDYDWKQLSKMTHLEPFYYPVWSGRELENVVRRQEGHQENTPAAYVLFDYKNRNPLTSEAATAVIYL